MYVSLICLKGDLFDLGGFMFELVLNSLDETRDFSKRLADCFKNGDVFSFYGDLGAGKTTITKFIAKNLNIKEDVTSPTFNIVNVYYGKFVLNHMDLYRIENPDELYQIDYETYFYPDGVTIIEWAKNAKELLPCDLIEVFIVKVDDNKRKIVINGNNLREREIINKLK